LQPPRSSITTSGPPLGQPETAAPDLPPVSSGAQPWRLCGTPYTRRPPSLPPRLNDSDPNSAGISDIDPPSRKRARSAAGRVTRSVTRARADASNGELAAAAAAAAAPPKPPRLGATSRTMHTNGMGSSQRWSPHVARMALPR